MKNIAGIKIMGRKPV